jgi:hypothetical protein
VEGVKDREAIMLIEGVGAKHCREKVIEYLIMFIALRRIKYYAEGTEIMCSMNCGCVS